MRVKINAPDSIEHFAASKYAREWLNKNHKRTDDPSAKRPRKADPHEEEEATSGKK